MREAVTEIIQKECEQYNLIELGLVTSVEKAVEQFLRVYSDADSGPFCDFSQYREWRRGVIDRFYHQLKYADFLEGNSYQPVFTRFVFSLRKRLIRRIQERWVGDTIDSILTASEHTLAFKLSVMLSKEADQLLYPQMQLFRTPFDIESHCALFCQDYYPVDLEKLLARLRINDPEFWDEIYLLIKKIARRVTSYSISSNQYKDETEQDTWSESSLLLRDKIISGTFPLFESALHFRNYLIRVCQNKCHEAMRRNRKQELSLDDPTLNGDALLMSVAEDLEQTRRETGASSLSDIDLDCAYEVSCALTSILWDKTEPWYAQLTKGLEEKVTILLSHYVQGLSYEQIAALHAPGLSASDRQRLQAKLRQDVVRVRKTLKERFVQILKKEKYS